MLAGFKKRKADREKEIMYYNLPGWNQVMFDFPCGLINGTSDVENFSPVNGLEIVLSISSPGCVYVT